MAHLLWDRRPDLNQPVLIAAFEGWNDAGDAASHAIDHLIADWGATPFARLDPEDFYDFTATRPEVRLVDGQRVIDWPENVFHHARCEDRLDVVLLRGVEPQLRWRTFAGQVTEVAEALGARLVLTLGALLADVPHTRPTSVFGSSQDDGVRRALHLEPSRYEGPTGIIGVLGEACGSRGINTASLWAAVPSYVAAAPAPKAAAALVDRVSHLLGVSTDLGELVDRSADYERQISELVAEDPETEEYVRHLEEQHDRDSEVEGADALVAEVERFLREQ